MRYFNCFRVLNMKQIYKLSLLNKSFYISENLKSNKFFHLTKIYHKFINSALTLCESLELSEYLILWRIKQLEKQGI